MHTLEPPGNRSEPNYITDGYVLRLFMKPADGQRMNATETKMQTP